MLSLLDQMFLRMESPRTPMHIGALATFRLPDGAPETFVKDLSEAFAQMAFLPFPFDSAVTGLALADAMAWEQVVPDPERHVFLHEVPDGTEANLGRLVERLHSEPLDLSLPLWEAHLIDGLEGGRFAFYFKAHHAAVDGLGAVRLITEWLSTDPDAGPALASAPGLPVEASLAGRLRIPLRRAVEGLVATGELLRKLPLMTFGPDSTVRAATRTPRTPFNRTLTSQRRFATQVLALPRLRAVAQATGTTVNDVVLACVAGSVRRYLQEEGGLPKRSLNVSVPVGFDRDEETINAATGFVVPLGTDEADPLARLRAINAATQRGKKDIADLSANAAEHYTLLGLVPLAIGQRTGLLKRLPPIFNFTVSNVVLSKEPLYLLGAELELLAPISFLVDGYGLNVTLVGYTDKVVLGLVGCRDTVPHLQHLAVYAADALDELEALVSG